MTNERARAAAEEILAPLRGERLEHEVYTVLARRVADVVAQAVKERDEELKWVKADYATTLDVKNLLQAKVSEQAEEIARLRAEAELVPAVLAEKYQEGREDGITWAQQANDGAVQAAGAAERERIAELADNWPSECLASGGEECCGPGLAAALRAAGEGAEPAS